MPKSNRVTANRRPRKDDSRPRPDPGREPPRPVDDLPLAGPDGYAPVRPLLEWLFTGYFVLLVLGFVMLRLPGTMARGNELTVDRAVFTSVNAATLTGFQMNVGIAQFKEGNVLGPAAVLLQTVGGTFIVLVTASLLAVRILRLPYTDGQVVTAASTTVAAAAVVGGVGLIGGGRGAYDAVLLAAAAFGNSGVHTGPLPGVGDGRTHLVLLPLALLGGLGLPVVMEVYDLLLNGKPLSPHSRAALRLTAGFYVAGLLLLVAARPAFWDTFRGGLTTGGWTVREGGVLRHAVASASAGAINARTAGLPLEYAGALPRAAPWVLLVLMAVGANPAGTGGGLKTTTVLQLVRGARSALAGRAVPRAFGIAAAWVAAYGLIVAGGFVALLCQTPQVPADHLLFLAVSAASNVGLSHDALSLVGGPLYVLSAVMTAGRVVPLLILWWMAETTGDADLLVA